MRHDQGRRKKGSLAAYLAGTWVMWLITIVTCLICAYTFVEWQRGTISFGKALLWGGLAFVFCNAAIIGAAEYYMIHFGMTDDEIVEYVKKIKEDEKDRRDRGE